MADQDKALEEEPKHQKGKHKAASEGVFKAPKSPKTSSTISKSPSPTSKKLVEKPKKRKTKVYSFYNIF